MADTCRQRIVNVILARLGTVPPLECVDGAPRSVNTELNRRATLGEADLPSQILFEGVETSPNIFSGEDDYIFPLFVQGAVQGTGAEATLVANRLRGEAMKALLVDRSLGGLVRVLEVTEPGDFVGVDVSVDAEGFLIGLRVEYATREGDPFTFAP